MRARHLIRQSAALGAVALVVALTGCSPTRSALASDGVDLARLAALDHHFPPGFVAHAGEVRQVERPYVDQVGTTVSYGKSFNVDPAQCRALLKPVVGTLGANYIGVGGDGPDDQTIFVGASDQVTVPAEIPATGCDKMTFDVDSAIPSGTADRIPAPHIDGANTYAFTVRYGATEPPEYYYIAILGDVYVHVDARVGASLQAQRFLPDLLVTSVAAIRAR